jgi:hypothetical protein
MAGKGKIVRGALEALTDAVSSVLPDNIFDLPSFKEATRAFKRSLIGDEHNFSVAEKAAIPDAEVDGIDIGAIASGFGSDKDIFKNNPRPFLDWMDGKIDLQDFTKTDESGELVYGFDDYLTDTFSSGSELLGGANYPLDPRAYVLRDLEQNYKMSKPGIIEYLKKNDLLQINKESSEEIFDQFRLDALKKAFAEGDPNNPIVKKIRGALADLSDDDDLIAVDDILGPEDIYGKPN